MAVIFQSDKHQPLLVQLLCEELQVKPEQLMDFDLHVADTQPAVSFVPPFYTYTSYQVHLLFMFPLFPENQKSIS